MNKQSLDGRIKMITRAYEFGTDWLVIERKELYKLLSDVITEVIPEKMTDDFKYFKEDKSRGWTQEQLTERVWAYNNCIDQVHTNLNNLLGEKR